MRTNVNQKGHKTWGNLKSGKDNIRIWLFIAWISKIINQIIWMRM